MTNDPFRNLPEVVPSRQHGTDPAAHAASPANPQPHAHAAAGHAAHAAQPVVPLAASAQTQHQTQHPSYHAEDSYHAQGSDRKRGNRRTPFIVLGVLAGIVVVAYAGGVIAFSNICYPRTSIAGVDVGLMDRKTTASRVSSASQSYALKVSGQGFDWTYKPEVGQDLVDTDAVADRVISGNEAFIWPVRLAQHLMEGGDVELSDVTDGKAELPDSFDREAFQKSVDEAVDAFNAKRAGTFDAAGAYDEQTGKFTVEKARSNQKLDKKKIEEAAERAIATLDRTVELDGSALVPLANGATDEQLQQAVDAANKLIGTDVNLKMGGKVVATLDGKQLAQWMTFDDKLQPALDTDQVEKWTAELAKTKLDTVGTKRTYTREDGKKFTVDGGTYGWTSDEAALTKALQDAVAKKQTGDIEVPVKQKADVYTNRGERDWKSYIDVDLTEQHARYYDDSGKIIWESGFISGNPNSGHETPTGIYKVNSNDGGALLVGSDENGDGEPDYKTPVKIWIPFVGGAIGFHDADWQASANFSNPSAYLSVGSHGCINLPPSKAKELQGVVKTGVCVVVHK